MSHSRNLIERQATPAFWSFEAHIYQHHILVLQDCLASRRYPPSRKCVQDFSILVTCEHTIYFIYKLLSTYPSHRSWHISFVMILYSIRSYLPSHGFIMAVMWLSWNKLFTHSEGKGSAVILQKIVVRDRDGGRMGLPIVHSLDIVFPSSNITIQWQLGIVNTVLTTISLHLCGPLYR